MSIFNSAPETVTGVPQSEGKYCPGYWEELSCEGPCVEGIRQGFQSKIFHFAPKDGGRGRRKDEVK